MRITLNLEDDVFRAMQSIAESTSRPIGKVASDLIRKALRSPGVVAHQDDLPVFDVGELPSIITLDDIRKDGDEG